MSVRDYKKRRIEISITTDDEFVIKAYFKHPTSAELSERKDSDSEWAGTFLKDGPYVNDELIDIADLAQRDIAEIAMELLDFTQPRGRINLEN